MRSQRRKQVLTLSILAVSVIALSVGFAAFSSVLRINTTAQVTPYSNAFSVKFSTAEGTTATTGTVTPTVSASAETTNLGKTVTASNVTVDGTTTLTGLNASFISPGDSVTYSFYVVNEGAYDAYLNSVNFIGTKTCTAGTGTSQSLVNDACDDITTTITVGSVSATNTKLNISGETLTKTQSKQVTVTISYDENGARADGPFSIEFGDISLYYSSITGENEQIAIVCTLADSDKDRIADTGEVITCTKDTISEGFYVVDSSNGNINMLAKYNLVATTTSPIQDTTNANNPVEFSSSAYWYNSINNVYTVDANYALEGRSYAYVYNSRSNLYPYVEAYREVLEGMGVNVTDAKLLSYEQATKLGCSDSLNSCKSAPSWVYSSSYWLGSAGSYSSVWRVYLSGGFDYVGGFNGSFSSSFGVRPLITISASDLG